MINAFKEVCVRLKTTADYDIRDMADNQCFSERIDTTVVITTDAIMRAYGRAQDRYDTNHMTTNTIAQTLCLCI